MNVRTRPESFNPLKKFLLRGNDDVMFMTGPHEIPEEYLRKSTITCEGGDEEGDMITDSCID